MRERKKMTKIHPMIYWKPNRHFATVLSFSIFHNPMRAGLLILVYIWGNRGWQKWGDLYKIAQLHEQVRVSVHLREAGTCHLSTVLYLFIYVHRGEAHVQGQPLHTHPLCFCSQSFWQYGFLLENYLLCSQRFLHSFITSQPGFPRSKGIPKMMFLSQYELERGHKLRASCHPGAWLCTMSTGFVEALFIFIVVQL